MVKIRKVFLGFIYLLLATIFSGFLTLVFISIPETYKLLATITGILGAADLVIFVILLMIIVEELKV